MVDPEFITQLKQSLEDLEQSRGEVALFALLKMDELTEKWTAIISAPWVADTTFADVYKEFRESLINRIGSEMSTIARIGIFDVSDHLSELILDRYTSGAYISDDQQINGNLVHEGYIIKSVKDASQA